MINIYQFSAHPLPKINNCVLFQAMSFLFLFFETMSSFNFN